MKDTKEELKFVKSPKDEPLEPIKRAPMYLIPDLGFSAIYKEVPQPLAEIFRVEGNVVGINRRPGSKRLEHTAITREIEKDLAALVKERNYEGLELKLIYYYSSNSDALDDTLKYLIFFYKVRTCCKPVGCR